MKTRSLSLAVSPEIGEVSAELITPDKPVCVMTLAHGAGAGMNHEFMLTIAKSLAEKDIATLRFNFPFFGSLSNQRFYRSAYLHLHIYSFAYLHINLPFPQ